MERNTVKLKINVKDSHYPKTITFNNETDYIIFLGLISNYNLNNTYRKDLNVLFDMDYDDDVSIHIEDYFKDVDIYKKRIDSDKRASEESLILGKFVMKMQLYYHAGLNYIKDK